LMSQVLLWTGTGMTHRVPHWSWHDAMFCRASPLRSTTRWQTLSPHKLEFTMND